jgi:hypothetical protein
MGFEGRILAIDVMTPSGRFLTSLCDLRFVFRMRKHNSFAPVKLLLLQADIGT